MRNNYIRIGFLFILAILSVACNRKSQLLYMSNVQNELIGAAKSQPYLLRPGDVLSVQIITQDPDISKLYNFNTSGNIANPYSSEISTYLTGYSVSDSGVLQLPILGKIKVDGLSVRQAQEKIQQESEKYLKDGLVLVKLINFKVTVIGEVKRPGTYTNYNDNLNIFEAIGLAGDLSDFGERSNVLVLRQTPEGVKTFRLNLHDKNILISEGFYLLPNDTVIVEPRQGKVFSMNSPNVQLYLSIVTTTLLMLNLILK